MTERSKNPQLKSGTLENVAKGKEQLKLTADETAGWIYQFGINGTNEQQLREWLTNRGIVDVAGVPYQDYAVGLIRPLILQILLGNDPKALDKRTLKAIADSDQKIDEAIRNFRNPNWQKEIELAEKAKIPRKQREERIKTILGRVNIERGDMLQKMLLIQLETVFHLAQLMSIYETRPGKTHKIVPWQVKVNFAQELMTEIASRAQQKSPHEARFFTQNISLIKTIIETHLGITPQGEKKAREVSIPALQAEYEVRKTIVELLEELLNLPQSQESPELEFTP